MKTDEEWRSEKYEDIFVNESRHCNSQLFKVVVKNYFPTMQQERNTGEETAVRSKKQWREELVIFFGNIVNKRRKLCIIRCVLNQSFFFLLRPSRISDHWVELYCTTDKRPCWTNQNRVTESIKRPWVVCICQFFEQTPRPLSLQLEYIFDW